MPIRGDIFSKAAENRIRKATCEIVQDVLNKKVDPKQGHRKWMKPYKRVGSVVITQSQDEHEFRIEIRLVR